MEYSGSCHIVAMRSVYRAVPNWNPIQNDWHLIVPANSENCLFSRFRLHIHTFSIFITPCHALYIAIAACFATWKVEGREVSLFGAKWQESTLQRSGMAAVNFVVAWQQSTAVLLIVDCGRLHLCFWQLPASTHSPIHTLAFYKCADTYLGA